ncbi:MAG TPA: hypothetical protein DCY40_02740 [Actinobacteria bacterium]|nr:hypothetical protein [Actinomycetota bacterium]
MTALDEHQLLVLLVQLALLVGAARALGGLARRIGQPPVVGELLAGVLLGPSVFAKIAPDAHAWVFVSEPRVSAVTFGLAWLGVVFLLVVMGYETDLGIISRYRRAALWVAAASLVLPMLATGAFGYSIAATYGGEDTPRWVIAAFFALGLSVSALPVIGKILKDLGMMRRDFGQMIIAAAMAKDAVGWLVLAVLTGVALGAVDLGRIAVSFGGLALFAALMLTVGRWLLDAVSKRILARGGGAPAALTIVVVAALGGAAITQALHVEAILGAYLVGLALSLGRYQLPQVRNLLETMTAAFFAPIFFAYSGLRVDISLLGDPKVALVTLGAVSLAVVSKVVGSIIGGRLAGLSGPVSRVLGVGLTPLGVMGVVVAIIAFTAGAFDETLYTILVLAAVFTSMLAPVILGLVVGRLPTAPEEAARLEWESLLDESEILRVSRILLPTRGGANIEYAARLVSRVFAHAEVTVLVIDVPRPKGLRWRRRHRGSAADPRPVLAAFGDKAPRLVRRVSRDPAEEISRESRLGYGLIVMGASESGEPPGVLTATVVDRVMTRTEIPMIVVHTPDGAADGPDLPEHILVPVTASRSARAAEEFAYSVARATGSQVTAIHVINRADGMGEGDRPWLSDSTEVGEALARSAREFGERVGVDVNTEIKRATSAEQEIIDFVRNSSADLLVLGASARPLSHRPFLGHRVGFMIEHAAVPVVVIALPSPR